MPNFFTDDNLTTTLCSGLMDLGITLGIGWIPVQTPLGAQPDFRSQPNYELHSDLQVEQE